MSRLETFVGSIPIGSGMKPKGDYPLMEAHDIVVDEKGKRLDDRLKEVGFTTDDTLSLEKGVLRVNTVNKVNSDTADNTLPITAAAVNVAIGNIDVLLQTI